MIPKGSYQMKAVEWRLDQTPPKDGKPGTNLVRVMCQITEGTKTGERVEYSGWLTDKAIQWTLDSLKIMGLAGRISEFRGMGTTTFMGEVDHRQQPNGSFPYVRRVRPLQRLRGKQMTAEERAMVAAHADALAERFAAATEAAPEPVPAEAPGPAVTVEDATTRDDTKGDDIPF